MVNQIQYLCKLIAERRQSISSDRFLFKARACSLVEIGESKIDLVGFGAIPQSGCEAESDLVLGSDSFLIGRRFVAEAELRSELHLFKFPLHILGEACFPSCPLVSNIDLVDILSLPSDFVVVYLNVPLIHVPLLSSIVTLVEHVTFLVLSYIIS